MTSSAEKNKFSAMCRLCMDTNVLLVNIHPNHARVTRHTPGNILEVIETFTTIKIDPLDTLPQKICESCIQTINSMLAFRSKCKRTNDELHKMIGNVVDEATDAIEILDDSGTEWNFDADDEDDADFLFDQDDENGSHTFDGGTIAGHHQDSDNDREASVHADEFEVKRSRPEKVACHICGKLYDASKMKYHMNEHNGLKPFECNEANCTSKFSDPHYLSKHKRFCHSLKPLLFCDVCGRGFKIKTGLEMHRSYHFDPNIPCTICEKLFRNKRALNKHMLVHSQERKFKCDTCGKSYQTRYSLRIHSRVHTQEKPYPCHCGVSFAYKCLLKAHTEKYHKLGT